MGVFGKISGEKPRNFIDIVSDIGPVSPASRKKQHGLEDKSENPAGYNYTHSCLMGGSRFGAGGLC
jgi:hypothetical protein